MSVELPATNFPRMNRQGWMLGLTGGQLIVCGVAAVFLMQSLPSGDLPRIASTLFFITVPLAAFGVASYQRRALTTITWERCAWVMRKALGQTTFKIRPETPTSAMSFGLPGVVGARISVHKTGFAEGAMLWDARAKTATAVLRCTTSSFNLASDSNRAHRAGKFADLCVQLVKHEGVVRVGTYTRTRPTSAAELRDYYQRKVSERGAGPAASPWADAQYQELLSSEAVRSKAVMSRDVLVAITISFPAARKSIKAGGGGKRGMSYVMANEIVAFKGLLEGTGVDTVTWLDTAGISEVIRTAFDPGAVEDIDLRRTYPDLNPFNPTGPVTPDSAGPTALIEHVDHMETDSGLHRTFWVAEWPRTVVEVGFLAPLVAEAPYPHVFTQVFAPIPIHQALKRLGQERTALDSKIETYEKLGRDVTAEMLAQRDDLDEREQEITDGFGAVKFTAYLTVSGTDAEALEAATSAANSSGAGLDLRVLKRQQAQAFTAGMLPVGWGLK